MLVNPPPQISPGEVSGSDGNDDDENQDEQKEAGP